MIIKKNKKTIMFDSRVASPYGITDKKGGMLFYSPSLASNDRYEELSDHINTLGYKLRKRHIRIGKDLADA